MEEIDERTDWIYIQQTLGYEEEERKKKKIIHYKVRCKQNIRVYTHR